MERKSGMGADVKESMKAEMKTEMKTEMKAEMKTEMKTEYRRDLQHAWMILSGGEVPEKDAYAVRMLTENRIDGLVPCKAVSLDGDLRFYYDISSRHALHAVLETEQVGRKLLEQILISLAKVLEELAEYLLDPEGLLLDPVYLFCNSDRSEIRFCWYPGKEMRFGDQARILGNALLSQLDQSDRAGVVLGYQFYQCCESGDLTPGVVRRLLHSKQTEREERPATKEEIERAAILDSFFDEAEKTESVFGNFGQKLKMWFSGKRKKKDQTEQTLKTEKEYELPGENASERVLAFGEEAASYGENTRGGSIQERGISTDTLLEKDKERSLPEHLGTADRRQRITMQYAISGEAETTLLTPDMLAGREEKIWILRVKEGHGKEREIPLTGSMYFIGKTGSCATLQLESAAVSRLHAKLEKKGENWCLTDMNSKNGTRCIRPCASGDAEEFLLQPEETVVLQEGDEVWFANVMCQVIRR